MPVMMAEMRASLMPSGGVGAWRTGLRGAGQRKTGVSLHRSRLNRGAGSTYRVLYVLSKVEIMVELNSSMR